MVPWAYPSLQPNRHVDRFSRFCTAHRRVSNYFTVRRFVYPKNFPFSLGDRAPHLTHGTWTHPSHQPNGISIGSAVFVWVPNVMLYNALSVGKKPPKLPLPLGFRHPAGGKPSHGQRQHAQKFGKDRKCGSGDVLATDRQTDTQTCSLQYFATAPTNEVIMIHSNDQIQQLPA